MSETQMIEYERGRILQFLADNEALEMPIEFRDLLRALDKIRLSYSSNQLHARLEYLAQKGCVKLIRRQDEPDWDARRSERGQGRPRDVVAVKLTAEGLDVVQRVKEIPGVKLA